MKTHEYQAREVLSRYGVPFGEARVVETAAGAEEAARELGGDVVVKAQVHTGGRGKAGGVKLVHSPEEAGQFAAQLLGSTLKGFPVERLLIAKAVPASREFYVGVLVDRGPTKAITVMASTMGGVDIEEVSKTSPEKIVRVVAHPLMGMGDYQARDLSLALGLSRPESREFTAVVRALYKCFMDKDCSLLEINPLAFTEEGELVALDSKMTIDDNALCRQPEMAALRDVGQEQAIEVEAQNAGVVYVKLDGTVGCMVNGAGLAMATMDLIQLHGGEPANFLDFGGGPTVEKVRASLRLILKDPNVRTVLVNIFGGITRCDVVAQALLDALNAGEVTVPTVVRLVGTNAAEGRQMLARTEVKLATTISEAAELVVSLANDQGGRE